jgi:hypothetical protein
MENQMNLPPLNKTLEIKCDECEGKVFAPGFMLRTISKFEIGADQDALIPISVYHCITCNHVNDQFIPSQLK